MYRGDRGLFWLGDPKILFATAPTPDAAEVCRRWGYPGTTLLAPSRPTHQLCMDVLRDPSLVACIRDYAGTARRIRLIPYAATAEFYRLAGTLQNKYGLEVVLPESPAPDLLWLRDYADSKAGFRALVSECLTSAEVLPPGFVCKDIRHAAGAVEWFLQRGEACVVKADGGESGIGHIAFHADLPRGEPVRKTLEKNPFLRNDNIIVEKYIQSRQDISPSLELFVPPASEGAPRITYLSRQHFTSFGRFAGVVVSRDLEKACWYPPLCKMGLKLANHLQELGYVGHFDLDAVVDDCDRLFLLETNARRTGGTYVHEFATHTFGPAYLQNVALMSIKSLSTGGIKQLDALLERLSGLLYPIHSSQSGVVVTVTSTLSEGEFGCILVADCESALTALHQSLLSSLQSS